MLFENRKQITAEALMMKYGTREDYEKILKKPAFEVAKSKKRIDKVNIGKVKTNKSNMIRSHFMATDKASKLKVEIRYAESNNTKIVGDRVVDQFEPRYVSMSGATFAFQNDIDKAVFLFLHPNNGLSTLRPAGTKAGATYEYIDTKKRAQAKSNEMDALTEAMSHSSNLSDEKLILLAKGLGLKGIDKKDVYEIRTEVREYAMKFPKEYNQKINTELTYVEGRIWNLIDKGVFKLTNVGTTRRWSWSGGERDGEFILDIQNVTQDARVSLKNYIFNDLTTWMNLLSSANTEISSRENAERALKAMQGDMMGDGRQIVYVDDPTERVIGDALPTYLKESAVDTSVPVPKYTEEDAIRALQAESDYPDERPHHMKIQKWLREHNA